MTATAVGAQCRRGDLLYLCRAGARQMPGQEPSEFMSSFKRMSRGTTKSRAVSLFNREAFCVQRAEYRFHSIAYCVISRMRVRPVYDGNFTDD